MAKVGRAADIDGRHVKTVNTGLVGLSSKSTQAASQNLHRIRPAEFSMPGGSISHAVES
jgi:hypothetical protein